MAMKTPAARPAPTSSKPAPRTPTATTAPAKPKPAGTPATVKSAARVPLTTPPLKTPSKVPGDKLDSPKPINILEIYQFIKRQIFLESAPDPERDAVIKNKLIEAGLARDGFNVEDDLEGIRHRITRPCEDLRAESTKIQEDVTKQLAILRRKFVEEEAKSTKLQTEITELNKLVQELTGKLMFAENTCSLERSQSGLLLEKMVSVEAQVQVAARALEASQAIIGSLRAHSGAAVEIPAVAQSHPKEFVSQQISEAENAIKNLNEFMKNSEENSNSKVAFTDFSQEVENDAEGQAEEPVDEETEEANGEENSGEQGEEGANGEVEAEPNEDDEVIHVPTNGKVENHVNGGDEQQA